jgi:hypothetical protein
VTVDESGDETRGDQEAAAALALKLQGDDDAALSVIDESEDLRELCVGLLLLGDMYARLTAQANGWPIDRLWKLLQRMAGAAALELDEDEGR